MNLTEMLSSFCTIQQEVENRLTVTYKDKNIDICYDTFSDTVQISIVVLDDENDVCEDGPLSSGGEECVNALNSGIPSYQFVFDEANMEIMARKTMKYSDVLRNPFLLHIEIDRCSHLPIQMEKAYEVSQCTYLADHQDWMQLLLAVIDSWVAEELLRLNILYLHGFGSAGNSGTARELQELLPNCKVVCPDLPIDPQEALALIGRIVSEESIDLVIGTSMGGLFTMHAPCPNKVVVNPSFHVSRMMNSRLEGNESVAIPFFKPRRDGATEFVLTRQVVDAYENMETTTFDGNTDCNIVGIFGSKDDVVDCRSEYLAHYSNIRHFDGGHRLDRDAIQLVVIPSILQLVLNGLRK